MALRAMLKQVNSESYRIYSMGLILRKAILGLHCEHMISMSSDFAMLSIRNLAHIILPSNPLI